MFLKLNLIFVLLSVIAFVSQLDCLPFEDDEVTTDSVVEASTSYDRSNCLLNVPDSEEQDLGTTACSYKYKMHYYDPETNTCKRFTYGICVGKINRFFSRSACKKACIQSRTRATS